MNRTNFLYPDELYPALRRRCHAALCTDGVELPEGIKASRIYISYELDKDVFDRADVAVIYTEEASEPIKTVFQDENIPDTNHLLRGDLVRKGDYTVQFSVYSQDIDVAYRIGDMLMLNMDLSARRRRDLRYFCNLDRHSAKHEDTDSWMVVYKCKVQLQPREV